MADLIKKKNSKRRYVWRKGCLPVWVFQLLLQAGDLSSLYWFATMWRVRLWWIWYTFKAVRAIQESPFTQRSSRWESTMVLLQKNSTTKVTFIHASPLGHQIESWHISWGNRSQHYIGIWFLLSCWYLPTQLWWWPQTVSLQAAVEQPDGTLPKEIMYRWPYTRVEKCLHNSWYWAILQQFFASLLP